jgi:hypothetical protein
MNKAELKAAIAAENKRHAEVLKDLQAKLRVIEFEESARSKDAYKERKASLEESGEWLAKNKIIQVGDIVEVIGSKAGKHREVVTCQRWGIIGTVIGQYRVKTPEGIKLEWRKDHGKVTEQGYNKITKIMRDGKFISVKDLMEQTQG